MSLNSCTQTYTLIILSTTYMIVVLFYLYINKGQDTKTITCIPNLPWRCNGSCHLYRLILSTNMEKKFVEGGRTLLPSNLAQNILEG